MNATIAPPVRPDVVVESPARPAAAFDPPVRTVADLLAFLGDIPADRVRLVPTPGTAVPADLLEPLNCRCELVEGTLVEKPVGMEESFLAGWLAMAINQHITTHNLGYMSIADGFYELPGGTVRGPDVAFTGWDRLPGRRRPRAPIPLGSPDLAVEVLSPSNTRKEMTQKRAEYFGGGVTLVWEIDPRARTVRVYTGEATFRDLTDADTLDGATVLPGFVLPVAALWAELDRTG